MFTGQRQSQQIQAELRFLLCFICSPGVGIWDTPPQGAATRGTPVFPYPVKYKMPHQGAQCSTEVLLECLQGLYFPSLLYFLTR